MAKGHRSQIKRERNANKDTRPSAKLSYAKVSVQKACFVLDAIRGKDVTTAPLHCRMLCKQRTYNETYQTKSTGTGLQNRKENEPHYTCVR